MRNQLLSLIFFCLPVIPLSAEDLLIDSIPVPTGSRMITDNLENLYIITPTNDIIKFDKNGKKLATANYKVLGNVSSMDAGNPFEIYVFYRDQNKIIFLDNLLNIRGECDLESIGVSQVACISRSSDNNIWIFDMGDQKLKKYSKDLKLILESAAFNNFPIGDEISPSLIMDINSSVLILNKGSILEFDLFANFNKTVLNDTIPNFQFMNNKIIYLKNGAVHVFHKIAYTSEKLDIAIPENTRQFRLEKERIFILLDEFVILRILPE